MESPQQCSKVNLNLAVTLPRGIVSTTKGWSIGDKKLRIGVPTSKGFKELINVTGFCVDVFVEAIASLDYKVHYEFIPFVNAKGELAGSYNDLICQVYLKNYDAAVGDITILTNRLSYVDFTSTFTDFGVGMIDSAKSQQKQAEEKQLVKVCSDNMGVCGAYNKLSATLASMLTVQNIQLLTSGEVYIGYNSGLSTISSLKYENSRLKPYQSPKEYANALARGSKNGGVSAIVDEIPYIQVFLSKYSAYYTMIKHDKSKTSGFGFVIVLSQAPLENQNIHLIKQH